MKRGRQLILYGAGGHGAVVEAAIIADGTWKIAAVLDDGRAPGERLVINVVNGGREQLSELFVDGVRLVHVSIGDNLAREVVCTMMRETGFALQSIQHPRAYVESGGSIGDGTYLAAGAIICARASVGVGCIVNTGASVDHDSIVSDYVHICPGVRLAGRVRVGARTMIGTGASVIPGIEIGKDVMVGAGAVVIRNVPDGARVAGNPAKSIRGKTGD